MSSKTTLDAAFTRLQVSSPPREALSKKRNIDGVVKGLFQTESTKKPLSSFTVTSRLVGIGGARTPESLNAILGPNQKRHHNCPSTPDIDSGSVPLSPLPLPDSTFAHLKAPMTSLKPDPFGTTVSSSSAVTTSASNIPDVPLPPPLPLIRSNRYAGRQSVDLSLSSLPPASVREGSDSLTSLLAFNRQADGQSDRDRTFSSASSSRSSLVKSSQSKTEDDTSLREYHTFSLTDLILRPFDQAVGFGPLPERIMISQREKALQKREKIVDVVAPLLFPFYKEWAKPKFSLDEVKTLLRARMRNYLDHKTLPMVIERMFQEIQVIHPDMARKHHTDLVHYLRYCGYAVTKTSGKRIEKIRTLKILK